MILETRQSALSPGTLALRRLPENPGVSHFVQVHWGTLQGISRLLLDGAYTGPASIKLFIYVTADMLRQQLNPD